MDPIIMFIMTFNDNITHFNQIRSFKSFILANPVKFISNPFLEEMRNVDMNRIIVRWCWCCDFSIWSHFPVWNGWCHLLTTHDMIIIGIHDYIITVTGILTQIKLWGFTIFQYFRWLHVCCWRLGWCRRWCTRRTGQRTRGERERDAEQEDKRRGALVLPISLMMIIRCGAATSLSPFLIQSWILYLLIWMSGHPFRPDSSIERKSIFTDSYPEALLYYFDTLIHYHLMYNGSNRSFHLSYFWLLMKVRVVNEWLMVTGGSDLMTVGHSVNHKYEGCEDCVGFLCIKSHERKLQLVFRPKSYMTIDKWCCRAIRGYSGIIQYRMHGHHY